MANVCVGCGLNVDSTGKIVVDTIGAIDAHPRHVIYNTVFPCTADDQFPPIFCDSVGGGLRQGAPEHTSNRGSASRQDNFVPDEILPFNSPVLTLLLQNPSDCRAIVGFVEFASIATCIVGPQGSVNLFHNIDTGAGFSPTSAWQQTNEGTVTRTYTPGRPVTVLDFALAPGAAVNFRFNTIMTNQLAHAANRFASVATEIRYFFSTV